MKFAKIYPFIIIIAILSAGLLAVYSAVYSYGDKNGFMINQGISAVIGFIAMVILSSMSPHTFKKASVAAFFVSIALLLAVLVFGTGLSETGSKSWIVIGPVSFQPSEIAKGGFVLSFSAHIAKKYKTLNKPSTLAGLLFHIAAYTLPICLQPDFGTTIVFLFLAMTMLFFAGVSKKFFVALLSLCLASAPLLWMTLKEYQKNRILVFFNPSLDPMGAGYNVIQSKTALGSGGIMGQGFLNGMLTQSDLLPAKHTDFIFSVIGEEFGLLGCSIILILLFLIVLFYFATAKLTDDIFESSVCSGFGAMLVFHTIINTGMCIGLMPVTGIPLPFVSYGGTFLLLNLAGYGIAVSIRLHLPKEYRYNKNRRSYKPDPQ